MDTPNEGVEQHRRQECLKGAIKKGKVLGGKKQWTQERVGKASSETINKTYAEYKQRKLNEKVKKRESLKKLCNYSVFYRNLLIGQGRKKMVVRYQE